jgi:hypothetical protein
MLILIVALATAASAQFETRSSSPVTENPRSLAVADFNHDGKLDVAAAVYYTGKVAVLLGRGDGTFQPAVYYNIDSQLESVDSVAVADFNHDGNLDIAVADRLGQNISVLLGNGDGTFQPPVPFATNAQPTFVGVGDFNGDGNPDLIVADPPYISVLLGNGDGTFQPPLDNASFSLYPVGIAVGDLNRDGKLDVAAAGSGFLQISYGILLGNGDGTFQPAALYPLNYVPGSIVAADLNGDHKLDLVIGGFGQSLSVLLGNGNGTFQAETDYSTPNAANQVAVADFSGDGVPDIAVLGCCSSPLGPAFATLFVGNGSGTFQQGASFPAGLGSGSLAGTDLNGDHKPDLVAADDGGNAVNVLLNTGSVSFSPTTPLSFNPQLLGTASPPHTVTLTNTGTATLSITSISTKKPFQLGGGTTCGTSVAPGAKCTLSIIFKPTVMGLKSGLLVLNDSASSKPQVIELSGTGTTLTVSPSKLNFGSRKVGTKSPPQNVTVTNTGNTAVSVTGVSITGNGYYDYSETNTCGTQINAGATCTISITFAPITKGTRTALAQINGPGGVVWQAVSLTGTGT